VFILTSNLGSQHLVELKDGEDVEKAREPVMEAVRAAFRPEFLNRLDEVLLFSRLGREQMTGIVEIQLEDLHELLADRRVKLEIDEKAKKWLADQGYDPVYGARPLKRVIQTALQNKLAEMLLKGEIVDGSIVQATEKEGHLDFKIQSPKGTHLKEAA
jgi:ATP-dependent Clp protease ATP-binding subunit ClpB